MADINNVVLTGRLTRDAELKYTTNGQAVCKFSIAVNRRRKNGDQWEEEANFFDVTLWGKQGETLNQYLLKGKAIGVYGELRQDRWQQDGQNRSKVEIMANNVQFVGGTFSGGGGQGQSGGGQSPYQGGGQSGGGSQSYGNQNPGNQGSWQNNRNETPPADDHFPDDIPF